MQFCADLAGGPHVETLLVAHPLLTAGLAGIAVGAALCWFWSLDEGPVADDGKDAA